MWGGAKTSEQINSYMGRRLVSDWGPHPPWQAGRVFNMACAKLLWPYVKPCCVRRHRSVFLSCFWCWWQLCRAFNCRILYGHYLPTVILIIIGIPSPTYSFILGLITFLFLQILPTVAFPFLSSGFTTWISPDCLLLLLSISVFTF